MTEFATILCVAGIIGLFWLDREEKVHTSAGLWIAITWLAIVASRPLSIWLQINQSVTGADQYLEGSPFDRNFYLLLIGLGAIVLFQRRARVIRLVRSNVAILIFLLYCAISILWSDFPDVAFKRWIKFLGDYVMVAIVLTEGDLSAGIKRVLSSLGFVLLPVSILLIKYYPNLGRAYAPHWTGGQYFTGVTTDKNMLGATCLVLGIGLFWRFIEELRGLRRRRILVADGCVAAMASWLLYTCNSMTSTSCLVFACVLIVVLGHRGVMKRKNLVHALVAVVLLICAAPLFLGLGGGILSAVGRDATLSGRTELWTRLLSMPRNSLIGTGFESFWLGPRLAHIWKFYWWHPIESHDGYLEVFLNLGWVGVVLVATMFIAGYKNVIRHLRLDPQEGRLRLAYFVMGVAYNFTEAAIHTQSVIWIFFTLGIMAVPVRVAVKGSRFRVPARPLAEPVHVKDEAFQGARIWAS